MHEARFAAHAAGHAPYKFETHPDGMRVALLERVIYGRTFHHSGHWCRCEHCYPAYDSHGRSCAQHEYVPGNDDCVICGRSPDALAQGGRAFLASLATAGRPGQC